MIVIGGTSAVGKMIQPFFNGKYLSSKDFDVCNPTKIEDDTVIVLSGVAEWDCHCRKEVIDVNCFGAVRIMDACLPYMRKNKKGCVIFFSSIYSKINVPGTSVYSASKAFIDKFVKVISLEEAKHNIRINSIQLGYTNEGMGKLKEDMRHRIGLSRYCEAQDIVKTIQFIIDNQYITGQNIAIEGGIR